jgi:hypothetical protein
MFAPFDHYCAVHASMNITDITKMRIREIEKGFDVVVATTLNFVGLSMMVGYYIDLHMPILLQNPPPLHVCDVYRDKLAPSQNGQFPFIVGGPTECGSQAEKISTIVSNLLLHGTSRGKVCAATKLFAKGRPFPNSVRYIRPQLVRCTGDKGSANIASFMLRADALNAFPQDTELVRLEHRLVTYESPLTILVAKSIAAPSRALYNCIAKCIATIISVTPRLLLQASRVWGLDDVSAYTRKYVSKLPAANYVRVPTQDAPPRKRITVIDRFLTMLQTDMEKFPIRQVPMHSSVIAKQSAASRKQTGIALVAVWSCTLCGIVAVRPTQHKLVGAKDKLGMSMCISDVDNIKISCNNCKQRHFIKKIVLTGNTTTARLTGGCRTPHSIIVCAECAVVAVDYRMHGTMPLCLKCFFAAHLAYKQSNCVCGLPGAINAVPFFANRDGVCTIYTGCDVHVWLLPTEIHHQTPAVEYFHALISK